MKLSLRTCWRILAGTLLLILVGTTVLAGWFYFYRRDLPDVDALGAFAPNGTAKAEIVDSCTGRAEVNALPAEDMELARKAVLAAEGDVDPRSVPRRIYEDFKSGSSPYGTYSMQLARELFCRPSRRLNRAIAELRTSVQIERRFTSDQILTIYLNRAYFADGIYGIENAAGYYFGKGCRDLSPAEAALLAGLIRRPTYLSPTEHPDRALLRRNEVLDEMAKRGSLKAADAEIAKASPLGTRNP